VHSDRLLPALTNCRLYSSKNVFILSLLLFGPKGNIGFSTSNVIFVEFLLLIIIIISEGSIVSLHRCQESWVPASTWFPNQYPVNQ